MEFKIRTQPEEWACTKFCRVALNDDSAEHFIRWLCDHTREQMDEYMAAHERGEPEWYDPVESTWGWDAPRQRMAKLLWQLVHGGASDEEFYQHFSFAMEMGCTNSAELLAPIQQNLQWVMEGLFRRKEEDDRLGQGNWGERWWLPPEHSEFVRRQLKQTHAELIEQSSEYEDAVAHGLSFYVRNKVQAIAIPSRDPARIYLGERRGPNTRVFVWVRDTKGEKYPLRHGDHPYVEADGIGFEWGYGGHGPGALSRCILADALDGDIALAAELDRTENSFFERFILNHARGKHLKISRAAVLRWLKEVGKLALYEERRKSVAGRLAEHAKAVAEREALLARIQATGGLRSQRFDIVPDTFESSLYLDLMRMLEQGGAALRCARCGFPIPYDHSGRANKQRARSRKGLPIYHPECFAEYTKMRKNNYWQRRSQSPGFREQERERAREYRKLP